MLSVALYFLLSLVFIILSCLLFVYLFRKNNLRFEQVLPISLMSISLLMFLLTAIFHDIHLAFIITIATHLLGLAAFVIFDKQRKQTIIQFLRSPAIVVFVLLLIALFVINYGRILTSFDDLIHWGPFVADMLRLNDFYSASTNIAFSVHGDYPPAAAMFEVFYLKLSGGAEWLMFVASQLLCLSLLFPIFARFLWHKKSNLTTVLNVVIVLGLILAALLSVALQANAAFFYEIRIDTLLACAGAYGVFIAFTEGKKCSISTVVKLSILISFIILLKQVALVIALIVAAIYVVMLFAHRTDNALFKNPLTLLKKIKWLHVGVIVLALALPIVSMKVWSIQADGCLETNICTEQFSSKDVKVFEVPLVVFKQAGTPLQQNTASHFLNYIYTGKTLINFDVVKITYPQFILLFIGIMSALAVYAHRRKQRIADIVVVTIAVVGGYFGYLYVLLGTYLYGGFSEGEMNILASADRYIGTFVLMMILIMLMVLVEVWGRVNKDRIGVFVAGGVALIILSLALGPIAYKSIVPFQYLNYTDTEYILDFKRPLDEVVRTIKSDKDYQELSVVVLAECNEQAGLWESNYLRYQIRPNPYLVLFNREDEQFIRNVDYRASTPYVDPAGRENTNSENDISVYVIAMCHSFQLERYNTQTADLIQFDNTEDIKPKWQVFKTTARGDYYNTLDQRLDQLQAI